METAVSADLTFFLQPRKCGAIYGKVQWSMPSGGHSAKAANALPDIVANRRNRSDEQAMYT